MGNSEKLRRLRKQVKDLEEKVEQQEKRTNDSRLFLTLNIVFTLLEIIHAILVLVKEL